MTEADLHAMLDAAAREGARGERARARRREKIEGPAIEKGFAAALRLVEPLIRKAFDEAGHPRDHGKFSSKPGGDSGADGSAPNPHPDHNAHVAHVVEGLPEKLPPGVWAKVGDKCLTAAAKVYGAMLRATPAALKALQGLDAILTTGDDLKKFGYEPMGATESADAMRNATGISSPVAATIASHVLARAYVYAKSKLAPEVRKAFGLDGWAVTKAQVVMQEVEVHRGGKTFRQRHRVKVGEDPKAQKKQAKPDEPTSKDQAESGTKDVGEKVTPKEHKAAVAKARAKWEAAPPPTGEEVSENLAGIAAKGANKFRKDLVGNNKDRAKRRQYLYDEFGDGQSCPCVYCGCRLSEGTLEQDKLYTTAEGGRYRKHNIIPACRSCNAVRGDTPFPEFVSTIRARIGTESGVARPAVAAVPTDEHRAQALAWVEGADLSPEQKAAYAEHMAYAIAGLPDGVRSEVVRNMTTAKFSPTFHADKAALNAKASELAGKRQSGIMGFVHARGGRVAGLHLDGGDEYEARGTYVHELWHVAADGYHDDTPGWKAAWKAEIKNPKANNILSRYATTNEREGFAEFGRFVAEHGADEAKRRYPKCHAALVKQGVMT